MYLDERGNKLLEEVLRNPSITNKKLQEDFSLSRRQVDYSFKKINEWLKDQGKKEIQKVNGQYRINSRDLELFEIKREASQFNSYIPSEKERSYLIVILILLRNEELSLNHFIYDLEVSKNTVLQDMKAVQKILDLFDLRIVYSRSEGYHFEGSEWDKRSVMLEAIKYILDSFGGEIFLQKFMKINHERITSLQNSIMKIEKQLGLNFVDSEMNVLPYSFEGIFKRIALGKTLNTNFLIDFNELSDTREYEAIRILIESEDQKIVSTDERLYITLQLLTSKVVKKSTLSGEEIPKLKNALKECLIQFEKKSVVYLADKEGLLEKLFAHFKPAYYRIKYNLTTDYSILDKIGKEFDILHYIVKQSIDPLRECLNSEIPEKESMFITLFIGGHIIDNQEKITTNAKLKAVVVCPNGLSVSKLMKQTFDQLFPEIYFHSALSIREFNQNKLNYDLVFSVTPVETDKKLFIVNQMMDHDEKIALRKRVINEGFLLEMPSLNIDALMRTINDFCDIKDEKGLIESLKGLVKAEPVTNIPIKLTQAKKEIQLNELLDSKMIQRVKSVSSWYEAIELVSIPLIEKNIITINYVEEMKKQFPTISDYIILRRTIAIPHAEVEESAKKIGMSMIYIEEGLPTINGTSIHFVVVIAAIDKKTHFTSLLQLMELAGNQEQLDRLKQSKSHLEMADLIVEFIHETNSIHEK
ncbi:BglG family transcription antiterminator [Carnobacterium pleistocenium]|uniref:BglG family transcription antiterminator n=1 Tax=Carnobacterium pleistocenium TaxID=181073 RepID=UPI00054ECDAF|nr:BglG family transcription antiterminator [Carnobacterium pleistocenium]